MRAVERAGGEPGRVRVVDVDEPRPGPGTAVVAVRAFSLNRDELSLLEERPDGWRPGRDVAGEVGRTADWSELPAVLDDLREHRVGVKAVLTLGA